MTREIIEKNLERMTGKGEYDMPHCLIFESMGGSAGKWKGLHCAGANFYYDPQTGEINAFGNWQEIPEEMRQGHIACFRVAVNNGRPNYKIVGIRPDQEPNPDVKTIIRSTAEAYNKIYGFKKISQSKKIR